MRRLPSGPPATSHFCELIPDLRPFVQRRRIEVSAVRPRHSADLFVECHCVEHVGILKRPEQLALQNRPEVDSLLRAVLKSQRQGTWTNDLEAFNPVNGVGHLTLQDLAASRS